ncbi:hypothetical protein [Polyangium sp. y55x31]|uniref:hypothetical protein n=1 Tax=Polyangium sp. y55x31 TaxID=3042688 RepID=UPI002482D4DF|nr:hypothetical protein [Polyangium sp. y55x31]MDI1484841.1 hypothetical protein [Polyangium sp. y55x31]
MDDLLVEDLDQSLQILARYRRDWLLSDGRHDVQRKGRAVALDAGISSLLAVPYPPLEIRGERLSLWNGRALAPLARLLVEPFARLVGVVRVELRRLAGASFGHARGEVDPHVAAVQKDARHVMVTFKQYVTSATAAHITGPPRLKIGWISAYEGIGYP